MALHTYVHSGPSQMQINNYSSGVTKPGDPTPMQYLVLDVPGGQDPEALGSDLENNHGFRYLGPGNLTPGASSVVVQTQRARLTVDASTITGTSFVTVLSVAPAVANSHVLEIEAVGSAAVLLATGEARLTVNGSQVGTAHPLALLGASPFSLRWYLTTTAQTYTVALQMRAGAIGSATPQAGCTLIARELSA